MRFYDVCIFWALYKYHRAFFIGICSVWSVYIAGRMSCVCVCVCVWEGEREREREGETERVCTCVAFEIFSFRNIDSSPHMNESCHTWLMFYSWIRHVTRMNQSGWVMSLIWICHVAHTNKSLVFQKSKWLHVQLNKSCHTYESVWISHVTDMNQSCCCAYETYMNRSCCAYETYMNRSWCTYESRISRKI